MWFYFAVLAAAVVVGFAIRPKQTQNKVIAADSVDIPSTDVGTEIAVVFGTCKRKSPILAWYGDLRSTPIRSKGGKK